RRRRGVLFGAVARRHPRALRHGSADQVFPHRLRDRQLGRGGAAPRRGVAKGFGSLPCSNWLWLTPGCATMNLCPSLTSSLLGFLAWNSPLCYLCILLTWPGIWTAVSFWSCFRFAAVTALSRAAIRDGISFSSASRSSGLLTSSL